MRSVAPSLLVLLFATAPFGVQAEHVDLSDIRWACGGFGSSHPDDCGIDPIGGDERVRPVADPVLESAADGDWLDDDARVLGIDHNGDVRAYPVRMLNTHEIVNDVVGGDALSITFCPLCGSGVTFQRQFTYEGQIVETNFTASGYLWRTDMVMWDPETEQLWNQITGKPIARLDGSTPVADHADLQLDFIPTTVTTWTSWKTDHPDTLLLQPVAGFSYREHAYSVTDPENCDHGLSGERDCNVDGLHPKEQMVGVALDDGTTVAFPVRYVALEGGAITHQASTGRILVATADAGGGATITDLVTNETLPSTHMFWFAWHDHYPDTDVWLPASAPPLASDDGADRIGAKIAITAAIGVLALVFILWSARKQL